MPKGYMFFNKFAGVSKNKPTDRSSLDQQLQAAQKPEVVSLHGRFPVIHDVVLDGKEQQRPSTNCKVHI